MSVSKTKAAAYELIGGLHDGFVFKERDTITTKLMPNFIINGQTALEKWQPKTGELVIQYRFADVQKAGRPKRMQFAKVMKHGS